MIVNRGAVMGYIPFWTFLIVSVALAIVTLSIRKVRFADIQFIIMVIALGFTLDMIFCKWLALYHWVSMEHRGFYSLWACLFIYPSIAVIFLKFLPERMGWLIIYILLWSSGLTLLEIYIIKPLGIVQYPAWHIIPWSPVGYVLGLIWIQFYYKLVEKRLK